MKRIILVSSLSILIAAIAYSATLTNRNLDEANKLVEQAILRIPVEEPKKDVALNFGGHANNALGYLKKAQAELVEADKFNDALLKKPKQ